MAKVLMKGNEAIAESAIRHGCLHYFGYPITPQTEIAEYMAKRMPQVGGLCLQAESEISAINMVLGAASTGERVMTSSSSPGISLKCEGISYIVGSDLPCLIVNVQRGSPGLGSIQPSQQDYYQATRALGHGDSQIIVLAPSSVQELADHTGLAFDLGDKYRTPVMLLADGALGQIWNPSNSPRRVNTNRSTNRGLRPVIKTNGNTISLIHCIFSPMNWNARYSRGISATRKSRQMKSGMMNI